MSVSVLSMPFRKYFKLPMSNLNVLRWGKKRSLEDIMMFLIIIVD